MMRCICAFERYSFSEQNLCKVGDTLTAEVSGADDVDYAWYVLDDDDDDYTEATAVGTKSTYKVGQADLGKYILVVVEDEDGDIAVSGVTSAVAEKDVELPDDQIEGVISIADISGLQSDGTGLVGDTLRAIVPATIGSFDNVIFYRDGVQQNSTTQNNAAMNFVTARPGKYTVSVIGSDNKVYLSDSIDVVDTEAPAIVQAFAIEDDYSTPNIILSANADTEAVVTVALNKAYAGTIRIYKATDLKYTGAADVIESTVINNNGDVVNGVNQVVAMPTTAQVSALTMTTDAIGDANAYYYATAKTVAGLFGAKSVDLTSTLGKGAQPAATGIAITQNSSDPYSADVKFTNLRTDGTLYIMQSTTAAQAANDDTLKTAFDQGTQAPKVSTKVEAGTEKVTLGSAIDDIAANNTHYMAIFVPDNETDYATVFTAGAGTNDLQVAPKLTKFALSGNLKDATTAAYAAVTAAGPTAAEKYLVAKDQFGNSMAFTAAEAFAAADMTDAAPTVDVGVGATLAVAVSGNPAVTENVLVGVMTFAIDAATTVNEGKSFTIVLKTGQTLTLKNKVAGTAAASTWNISIS